MRKLGLMLFCALALGACATEPVRYDAAPNEIVTPNETRRYIVFFDYESTELSPDARVIVAQAGANAKALQLVRIELGGYIGQGPTARTDRALTARRFAAVEEVLAAEGVDRRLFAHVPLVDEVPLPATAVRRIEIDLIER